ncbi:MAG: glycosyltransferase family 39 protein [Ktedonobacteraceae bacterium]
MRAVAIETQDQQIRYTNLVTDSWLTQERVLLGMILLVQVSLSFFFLRNSASLDEGTYILAGHRILSQWFGGPAVINIYASYFSGYPAFYPVIAGVLDSIGGLELVRAFSMICMLLVTVCVYYITQKLFAQEKKSALFAALLFACQGSTLILSHLATYDALCLCLLAVATLLAVHVSSRSNPWLPLAIGLLLVVAFVAKYAAGGDIPGVIALLFYCTWYCQGWRKACLYTGLALFSFAVFALLAYIQMDPSFIKGLQGSTTDRVAQSVETPAYLLLHQILPLGGLLYGIGWIGLFLLFSKTFSRKDDKRFSSLCTLLILYATSLVPIAYHLYKGEETSLHKHIAFSVFFIMPLVGYACALFWKYGLSYLENGKQNMRRTWRKYYRLVGVIFLLLYIGTSTRLASSRSQWPNTDMLIASLRLYVHSNIGQNLAEDKNIICYYLTNEINPDHWHDLDHFQYTDRTHHQLLTFAAYKAAIQDGGFNVIELSDDVKPVLAEALAKEIQSSKKYDLVATIPYTDFGLKGHFRIWTKHTGRTGILAKIATTDVNPLSEPFGRTGKREGSVKRKT